MGVMKMLGAVMPLMALGCISSNFQGFQQGYKLINFKFFFYKYEVRDLFLKRYSFNGLCSGHLSFSTSQIQMLSRLSAMYRIVRNK